MTVTYEFKRDVEAVIRSFQAGAGNVFASLVTFLGGMTVTGTTIFNTLATFQGGLTVNSRIQGALGAQVTAANNLTLGTDGNFFALTGATQINLIDSTGWQTGSFIFLYFGTGLTVKHAQANSGAFHNIYLNGAVDYIPVPAGTLALVKGSVSWFEFGRKV